MLTEKVKKMIKDTFLSRARTARQELDNNRETVCRHLENPIIFKNEHRVTDYYRIEAYIDSGIESYIDSGIESPKDIWQYYAEFCKPSENWNISVFKKSDGGWLYGITAEIKKDTKQVVVKTYDKYLVRKHLYTESPHFYEEFQYLQSLLYAPKEEKVVSNEHYPHSCRQCGSPAYICPVFNKVDCSNPSCG